MISVISPEDFDAIAGCHRGEEDVLRRRLLFKLLSRRHKGLIGCECTIRACFPAEEKPSGAERYRAVPSGCSALGSSRDPRRPTVISRASCCPSRFRVVRSSCEVNSESSLPKVTSCSPACCSSSSILVHPWISWIR